MKIDNKNQSKQSLLENAASQWVNLVFAHIEYKKQNKKEDKNGKTRL